MTNPQVEKGYTAKIEAEMTAPPSLPSSSVGVGAIVDSLSTTGPEIDIPNTTAASITAFATTSGAVITLGGEDSERTLAATAAEADKMHNDDRTKDTTARTGMAEPSLGCSQTPKNAERQLETGTSGDGSSLVATAASVASGGTYRFQSQLPKLQVPPLSDTLERYLKAVEPILTAEEFAKTKTVVEEFKTGGEGDALQQALLDYSSNRDSYVEEFWDDSYLAPNNSVVLNLNPFFVFETPSLSEHFPGAHVGASHLADGDNTAGSGVVGAAARKKQAGRAASLLYSSLRFASVVKSETLPPDVWRGTPLCMSQHRRLFGVHRKAVANDPDEMKICEDSGHVVILCRNQFYFFSGLHPDGRVGVTEEELEEIVQAVQEDADNATDAEAAAQAVGALTTEVRGDWAMARIRLTKSNEHNKRFLQLVDTALFVLCLDHTSPSTPTEISMSCLHGSYHVDGDIQVGTCTNRWYDKLQIIVFQNGAAGVNFEHTWVDGHTVLRFASDVFADVIYRFANKLTSSTGSGRTGIGAVFPPDERPFTPCEGRCPQKMEWHLSADIRRSIYFAETRISDLIRQHDVQALEYHKFGKRFITTHKMSPDAFVQMGIVYGYYSLYGEVVAAYEPVLTKVFLKGRTEALRTVTAEVKTFLETFTKSNATQKQKMAALREAIGSHSRLIKLAARGKGVDRHLFALKCMAKKIVDAQSEGDGSPSPSPPPLPAIFSDRAWEAINHVILSTSNCGNPSLRLFGFGPIVRDGFGVGYIIKDTELKLVVTSKNRQTDRFVGKIREFFDTVFDIYRPAQERSRVRVRSPTLPADDAWGSYSMWGSFSHKSGGSVPL